MILNILLSKVVATARTKFIFNVSQLFPCQEVNKFANVLPCGSQCLIINYELYAGAVKNRNITLSKQMGNQIIYKRVCLLNSHFGITYVSRLYRM